jgi:hypothetical protein
LLTFTVIPGTERSTAVTAIQKWRPPVTADVAEQAGASHRAVSRVLDGHTSLGGTGVRAAPQQDRTRWFHLSLVNAHM